jgi:2,3-dihydroxybenzoate decarboxylase
VAKKPYIIALEEHYQDPEVKQLGSGPGAGRDIVERLDNLGALRIREMDEAGIDLQVLSHSIPGLQAVDAEAGPPLARRTNDPGSGAEVSSARAASPEPQRVGSRLDRVA